MSLDKAVTVGFGPYHLPGADGTVRARFVFNGSGVAKPLLHALGHQTNSDVPSPSGWKWHGKDDRTLL